MTKIVLNGCYGRFGLSESALKLYAELKGLGFYPENDKSSFNTYWTIPESHPERRKFIEMRNEPSEAIDYLSYNDIYDRYTLSSYEMERDDPILVEVVERLGKAANGSCARLYIEELPKGTLYRISEYDGIESLETRDNVDWKIA